MVAVSSLFFCFEALSVVFCLHYLYGEEIHFDLPTLCFIIIDVIWMEIIHFWPLKSVWTILIYPIAALYCRLKFGSDIKAVFVNNILYMIMISIIQATIMVALRGIFGIERMEVSGNLFISILTFMIVAIGLRKCRLDRLSAILQSNEKLIAASVVAVFINVVFFLTNYKKTQSFGMLYYAILGVSIVLISIAVIDIGKHKIRAKEIEAELHLHKLYEESFRNLIDDISARQHEFDNHINVIHHQHLLYKTYDELVEAQQKYCKEIIKENRYNKLLSKGNPVIICFLYGKFSEIEKRGIKITYTVRTGMLECTVPIHKMVELLGNLLNNAADAVQEYCVDGGRINVSMIEDGDMIEIEVANESEEIDYKRIQNFFKKGYSEKGEKRGYGLYNVKKICEEYGIEISCGNENRDNKNWLIFKLTIKNK